MRRIHSKRCDRWRLATAFRGACTSSPILASPTVWTKPPSQPPSSPRLSAPTLRRWPASCGCFPAMECLNRAMASSATRRRRGCCASTIHTPCGISCGCSACRPSGEMEQSVRTGLPAGEKVIAGGLWAYFAEHADANAIFNAAMGSKAQAHIAGVLAAYDFSQFKVIGDIGGGRGHLLNAVLERVPTLNGVLFDLPHVVADKTGADSPRMTRQAGDFFKDKLPVCDAYLVMEIIHDWSDTESIEILKAIRQVAPSNATLLLIEEMIPDDPGPAWSKMLDIHMLALIGGKQRTRREYEVLFDAAGFSFKREIGTSMGVSILEAARST